MFAVRDILIFAVLAGVLAAGALAAWPWSRRPRRFVLGGLTTTLGFLAWNLTLNATDARGFNVDAPVRERSASKAEPTSPVFPEQVQSGNAHQIAEALWDEIDREATQPPKSRPRP